MLKALELVGFKSFADRTRLEFPRGITVVVGPNGSGKSNIVDAIKWVLGEQSVRSLRGREMADVIFNGSATRRAANAAETTLVFDNSQRLLTIDTPEVQITRRVYRNGEGEYLINRQPCRLRDIRDLLAGTGLATEAYSVIEQGKVDVLLQSSPRDRRAIFEEAAGISRFKTKKLETLRRLERVDQNLLRLSDIVDEVDSRLKSVRLQAAKAKRYKQYSDRLQELRTQVGLADWRKLTSRLESLEGELAQLGEEIAGASARADAAEARALALELQILQSDDAIRTSESRIAHNRERIAAHESSIEHERRRGQDLEEEVVRHRRQLTTMSVRAGDLQQQLAETTESLAVAEPRHQELTRNLAQQERGLTELNARLDEISQENEQRRTAHLAQLRSASALGNQISSLEAQVASAQVARERGQRRTSELSTQRASLSAELEELRQRLGDLSATTKQSQQALRASEESQAERRRQLSRLQQELAQLRERHTGAAERAAVLEELEKRWEGLGAGVKEVMTQARSTEAGPLRHIRGLVADLLHVNVETAPLIEVALGEAAQHVVVGSGPELIEHLNCETTRFAGRVGFIRLDVAPQRTDLDQIDLTDQPGVVGRADRFVETEPEFALLARRLLGKTWIVDTLPDALTLAAGRGHGLNFVTRAGEMVRADDTLLVGPRNTTTGLISRRSELRTLKQQIAEFASKIDLRQVDHAGVEQEAAVEDRRQHELAAETRQLVDALGELRLKTGAAEERAAQLEQQHAAVTAELAAAGAEHDQASTALAEARDRLVQTEASLAELEAQLQDGAARAAQLEQARQRHSRETNAAKVELAKSEQQLAALRARQDQLARDQVERGRALSETRSHLALCLERSQQAMRNILKAESETAELYLRKEQFAGETSRHIDEREAARSQRSEGVQEAQRARSRVRKLEVKLHAKEMAANEVRHERTSLADRLRDDYNIELGALEHQPTVAELDERASVEREIADLRHKINSIGGVNLDALAELEELEARYASLSSQYKDLSSAKASLEQIIGKINADSRRLFAETLEVVREYFQLLFRKLFGGGHADIVLDEGVDILDSGIEIVARPPGKEPRNISLLSGGEKTLTCVALLLAIFRSRPSPFCVLDEVDAALDEANIERFIAVLHEFLAWTQFVVVTHSKKTMTCANTLYGITMQESGVSKRVSVRFEDVSDEGEILNVRETDDADAPAGEDETQAA